MLEEYQEILTVDEACEILRIGYNAMYELLSVNFEHRAPLARKTSPALTKI